MTEDGHNKRKSGARPISTKGTEVLMRTGVGKSGTLGDILRAALNKSQEKNQPCPLDKDYKWKSIEPLSEADKKIDLASMEPLYETWRASKDRLRASRPEELKEFNTRLIRRMSIETGILERIYDLDRGTTEALVTKGFIEELVARSSTDIEPARLIDILRDQEAAIQLVMDSIAGSRPLTKGLIHELHSILMRHQDTTTASGPFGKRVEIPLLKGAFKKLPNNPRRPEGVIHEYAPPLQVESEIERLLSWLNDYRDEDPIIVAAWFHHRFTQIHPYQDGNGRVVRALTALILLKAGLLPLVIDRELRTEYLVALELADAGDIASLASIFARLERNAIMQALSVDASTEIAVHKSLSAAVIQSLRDKFARRQQEKHAELRGVNALARSLRTKACEQIRLSFDQLKESVSEISDPKLRIDEGGPDHENAHWFKFEVVRSANETGKFANFSEDHYFVRAWIRVDEERLVFVTSFHHVGRELSGIMEATAFARFETFQDSDDWENVSQEFSLCSLEPFVFTYRTRETDIVDAFSRWLDAAIAIAIKEFGDRL